MNAAFKNLIDQLEPSLQKLVSSPALDIAKIPASPKIAGVYLFYDNDTPIYVGRTRNLKGRMRSHRNTTSPNMASFTQLMAFETYGRPKASYKKEGSRKQLYADAEFRGHFETAHQRLKGMAIKFIEMSDPKMQHLFEVYVAMTFNTPYNSFETS